LRVDDIQNDAAFEPAHHGAAQRGLPSRRSEPLLFSTRNVRGVRRGKTWQGRHRPPEINAKTDSKPRPRTGSDSIFPDVPHAGKKCRTSPPREIFRRCEESTDKYSRIDKSFLSSSEEIDYALDEKHTHRDPYREGVSQDRAPAGLGKSVRSRAHGDHSPCYRDSVPTRCISVTSTTS